MVVFIKLSNEKIGMKQHLMLYLAATFLLIGLTFIVNADINIRGTFLEILMKAGQIQNPFVIKDSSGNSKVIVDVSGKVGIDTIPTEKLTVAGNVKMTGTFFVGTYSSDPPGGTNGAIYYNTGSHKFRGFKNGAWGDMIGCPFQLYQCPTISGSYQCGGSSCVGQIQNLLTCTYGYWQNCCAMGCGQGCVSGCKGPFTVTCTPYPC